MDPQIIVAAQATLDFATDRDVATPGELDEVADRIRKAKKGLAQSYVATISKGAYPDESYQRTASWLSDLTAFVEIVKDGGVGTDRYEQWAGRRVKRVGGRFARSTTNASPASFQHKRAKRLKQRAGEDRLSTFGLEARDEGIRWQGGVPPSTETRQRAEQWLGAQLVADEMERELKQAFGAKQAGLIDLKVNIQDPRDPSKIHVANVEDYDPSRGRAVSVGMDINETELAQQSPQVQRQVRERMAMLEGAGEVGGMWERMAGDTTPDAPLREMSGQLGRPGELRPQSGRRGRFSEMAQTAGRALQGFGPTQGVGQFLTAAGIAAGSQTAQNLEPYVERAAARYTGTQVKPSKQIEALFGKESDSGLFSEIMSRMADDPEKMKSFIAGRKASVKITPENEGFYGGMQPAEAAFASRLDAGQTSDQLLLGARSDLAALAMLQQLPKDPMLNRLSQAAGKTLPSRGVIIDEEGHVLYEAVGQSDDHYTPFNATMLGAMEGGQFVRSRQRGGPSTEDLRTMLSTGARMATIASPSGVFELEIAPEARGAKRFGPQMQSMTDAYNRLLNAIATDALSFKDGKQYLGRLDDEAMKRVNAAAAKQSDPAKAKKAAEDAMRKEYVAAATKATNIDRSAIKEAKLAQGVSLTEAQRGHMSVMEWANAETDREIESRIRPLVLNGEGYDLALRALQARFPHLLRTARRRDTRTFAMDMGMSNTAADRLPSSEGQDKGYLAPGEIRTNERLQRDEPERPAQAGGDAGPAGGTEPGGAAPTEPTPTDQTPPQGDETPSDSPAVQMAQVAGQEPLNEIRQNANVYLSDVAEINALPENWNAMLGTPPMEGDQGSGSPPGSFEEARAAHGGSPRQVAPLYAAFKIASDDLPGLLDELDSSEGLADAIVNQSQGDMATYLKTQIGKLPAAPQDITDRDSVANNVAAAVQDVAMLHMLAKPKFVRPPSDPEEMAALDQSQLPLPEELEDITDPDEYKTWAQNPDNEVAMRARRGRSMLTTGAEGFEGLEFLKQLRVNMTARLTDLDRLERDLSRNGRTPGGADAVLNASANSDLMMGVTPDVEQQLRSDDSDERAEAIRALKGDLRMGMATYMFQAALEAGGADPKAPGVPLRRLRPQTLRPGVPAQAFLLQKSLAGPRDPHPAFQALRRFMHSSG